MLLKIHSMNVRKYNFIIKYSKFFRLNLKKNVKLIFRNLIRLITFAQNYVLCVLTF